MPGRHEMQALPKLTRYFLIRKNDVLAILLQGKKSLGYSDPKINLSRCHARSGRKLKTAIGFPGTNFN